MMSEYFIFQFFLHFCISILLGFVLSVVGTELKDLGHIQAILGNPVDVFYTSLEKRPIQYCTWSQILKDGNSKLADVPPFKANFSAQAEGKCGFTIEKVEKEHTSSWKFIVVFRTSMTGDRSDLDIEGRLDLNVVEPSMCRDSRFVSKYSPEQNSNS